MSLAYDTLSNLGEQAYVDFEQLRNPLKYKLQTVTEELGHVSARALKPLDLEQHYKKEFGLFLNDAPHTYASILQTPVELTQFREAGFYYDSTPRVFDYGWMSYLNQVELSVIEAPGTEAYIEIQLSGRNTPYNLTIGNLDLAQVDEQKLMGFLFGINTYPKNRRYNPVQSTIVYDQDLLPQELKPYLFLTDSNNGNWVNNQYKGIEKVYLSYESLERDILEIYVLSYERIIPVWMARVRLPKQFIEQIRIRKGLYNY